MTDYKNKNSMANGEVISDAGKYRIGAVTKLTGLSADVVRVWERRYGAVRPVRSEAGTRLYSDADIQSCATVFSKRSAE